MQSKTFDVFFKLSSLRPLQYGLSKKNVVQSKKKKIMFMKFFEILLRNSVSKN